MTMQTTEDEDNSHAGNNGMMQVDDDDDDDDDHENETGAPAFLDPTDQAIEVPFDDDDEPLDVDDEEEDDDDVGNDDEYDDSPDQQEVLPHQDEMSSQQIAFHAGPIYAVEFVNSTTNASPGGGGSSSISCIVTGSGDDQAAIHSISIPTPTPTPVILIDQVDGSSSSSFAGVSSKRLYQAKDSVVAIAVCSDFIALGSYDGRIIVVSTTVAVTAATTVVDAHVSNAAAGTTTSTSSTTRFELDGPTDVEWLNFHPTGTVLLAGSTDGTVWMYSVQKQRGAQCMQVFVGHEAAVTAGAFLHKVAATCSADGTIRIWAPKTGLAKHVFRCSEMGLTCLAVGGGVDGKLVLAGGEDGLAYCCHVASQKIIHRFEHTPPPPPANHNHINEEEEEEELEAPPISVEAVGFAPASSSSTALWCATGGVDGVLKIWDVTSGQCRHVCRVGGGGSSTGGGGSSTDIIDTVGGITRLQWIKQHYVVTCGTTGVVRLWDARNGTLVHTLTSQGRSIMNDLAVSVDDANNVINIATGSDDGIVRLFTVPKDVLLRGPLVLPTP